MEHQDYQDFESLLRPNDILNLLFMVDDQRIIQRTRIAKLNKEFVYVMADSEKTYEVPCDQILSALYGDGRGLYGFHCKSDGVVVEGGNQRTILRRPDAGWKIQRRDFPRLSYQLPMAVRLASEKPDGYAICGQQEPALLINLGQGGIGIQSNLDLSMGFPVFVSFALESERFMEGFALVVWTSDIPMDDRLFGFRYTYGLKFIDRESAMIQEITALMAQKVFEEL